MIRFFLRSNIQGATVTGANAARDGALRLDRHLMNAAGLLPFERIEIFNVTVGKRFETYVVEAPGGLGEVALSGSGPVQPGDVVTISAYCMLHEGQTLEHRPIRLTVDRNNHLIALEQLEAASEQPL